MGMTILSNMVYHTWFLEGQFVRVRDVSDPIPSMDTGLVWKKDGNLSQSIIAFSLKAKIIPQGKALTFSVLPDFAANFYNPE